MKSEKLKVKTPVPFFFSSAVIFRALFFTFHFSLFTLIAFAQEDAPKDSIKKTDEPKDSILDKGRYKREYNWTIVGAGLARNTRGLDGNIGVNYQFRGKHPDVRNKPLPATVKEMSPFSRDCYLVLRSVSNFIFKQTYKQLGIESGKEYLGSFFPVGYDRYYYELHFGLGGKIAPKKYLFGAFLSASFTQGSADLNSGVSSSLYGFGPRLDLQAIYRPYYDVGFGFNLFGVHNNNNAYIGFRFVAFFSNAFKKSLYPKAYHVE